MENKDDKRIRSFLDLSGQSLSDIAVDSSLNDFHGDIVVNNIGDLSYVFRNLDLLRDSDIRVFLKPDNKDAYSQLKILCSLGIDCGLWINKNDQLEDNAFADLASYYFVSPVGHASIEPFAYISSLIDEETNINITNFYNNIDVSSEEQARAIYYTHFMNLDQCSKCKAFRICCGDMKSHLKNCEETMSEILDYLVLYIRMKNKEQGKVLCRL